MQNPLIVATDFSGLGSPEEALKRLNVNHRIAFACERDKYARASYEANHKAEIFYDDVTTRDNKAAPYADLYAFGFPCQAFSLAGHRKGFEDTRGTLFFNCLEYIGIHRPRIFIGENVKGLLSHDKIKGSKSPYGKTFGVIRDALALTVNGQHNLYKYDDCVNYHVCFQVLNTKDYTVPQNRERIFIVGFRDEADAIKFKMPSKKPLLKRLKDLLNDVVDDKYYLSDMAIERLIKRENYVPKINPEITGTINTKNNSGQLSYDNGTTLIVEKIGYINQDTQASAVYSSEGLSPSLCAGTHGYAQGYIAIKEATKLGFAEAKLFDSINLSNPNSETRRGRIGNQIANTLDTACNQAVVVGEPKLIQVMQLNTSHEKDGRVYSENGISQTLTSSTGGFAGKTGLYKVGFRIRRLTPLECFRLQGYSDDFFERCASINSDTQLYKQAGNSITVDTIMHLLIQILKAIDVPYQLAA